jgi:hypothetical protein
MYGKKPLVPFAKEHAWASELVCMTWTREKFYAPGENQTPIFWPSSQMLNHAWSYSDTFYSAVGFKYF